MLARRVGPMAMRKVCTGSGDWAYVLAIEFVSSFGQRVHELRGMSNSPFTISTSRSSGSGGQNVNKVNTKATLRLGLDNELLALPASVRTLILSAPDVMAGCKSTR